MDKIGTGKGFLLMALLMTLLLGVRHFDLLQSPNAYFIGDSLDGFRTMAANMYHIRHDATYDHFQGMHYPYGDHIGYADTFPLLSNAVKYFFKNDATWFPAIWSLSLIFSQLLCGLILFLVFRELNLPVWFSILGALGLSTLTPQLDRFAAHYCLSFSFLLPLTIFLLLRFSKKPGLGLSIAIALIPLLAHQIHSYHMAMVIFLVAGYFLFRFLHHPSWKNLLWLGGHGAIQVALPLIILLVTVIANDPVTDRPQWPWGFTFYEAKLDGLLLPIDLPAGRWINNNIADLNKVLTERRAYLGLVTIIGGLLLLIRMVVRKRRGKKLFENASFEPSVRYLLKAAALILLYAACFPFVFFGLEWMTDYLGLLRQFRVLSRFTWVFFYVSNIAVLYGLYLWIKEAKIEWQKVWFVLLFTVFLLEGVGYLFWEKYDLIPRPEQREQFSRADNPWLYSIDTDQYQAILPIPFFHVGSENFWYSSLGKQLYRSTWASVESGLPIMGAFMGRTSVGQTIKLLEAVAEPYRRPAILDDLIDPRPLLVFVEKGANSHLGYRFRHVLDGLTQLYEDETIILYELPLHAFERHVKERHKSYLAEIDSTKMYAQGTLLSADSIPTFVYQSFDDGGAAYHYRGGAKAFAAKEDHILFDGPLPNQRTDERAVVSFWSKMSKDLEPRTRMICTEYIPETGEIVHTTGGGFHEYLRSVDQEWMLIDIPVNIKRTDSALKVVFKNSDLKYGQEFYIDEFQIRSASSRVYRKGETEVTVNNRWIPRKQ